MKLKRSVFWSYSAMTVFPRRRIFLLYLLVCILPSNKCRYNRKYLPLTRRIIENVTLLNYQDKFTALNLQNATNLEFKNSHFPFFGEQIFRALNYATKSIIFRQGSVKEILISSPSLEVLQVINTGLQALGAKRYLNYNLRQLTIRSTKFSQWSPTLVLLTKLEEIDISYCDFAYLNMDWFESFLKLRLLDVARNRLTVLDIGPALYMGALQKLNLWGNQLTQLQRFPDAFPKMDGVTLSQNRWQCGWLSKARNAIWSFGIVLMDMDAVCPPGWANNGGLCCTSGVIWRMKVPKRKATVKDIDLEMQKVGDANGSVIGMRKGNSIVFLDQPLAAWYDHMNVVKFLVDFTLYRPSPPLAGYIQQVGQTKWVCLSNDLSTKGKIQ